MTTIKNPWGDGRDASVIEECCAFRHCLHIGENKGSFLNGRGYTRYDKNPTLVCLTNHLHGCPDILPDPDPERARCCAKPDFPKVKGDKRQPHMQRCRTCGTWAKGYTLEVRKGLQNKESA